MEILVFNKGSFIAKASFSHYKLARLMSLDQDLGLIIWGKNYNRGLMYRQGEKLCPGID